MKRQTKNNGGFTIIEVLIVLAIAALILLIIFLVVPALQRNARNHNRKNIVAHTVGELNAYYSIHGRYPLSGPAASQDDRSSFVSDLTNPDGPARNFKVRYIDNNGSHEYPFSGSGAPASPDEAFDEISIQPAHWCNRAPGLGPGDTDYPLTSTTGGHSDYHQFVVWTQLENAPMLCLDNKN